MVTSSWVELQHDCPIDISRIIDHARNFQSLSQIRISTMNLNKCKKALMQARCELDLMISTMQQLLYDREILQRREDEVLYIWLVDNLGRFLKNLDEKERELIINVDSPDLSKSLVGVSRISSYAKTLDLSAKALIYESLTKAVKEYKDFKETDKLKKEPRTFLYILFHVIQITLISLGGISREKSGGSKKGLVSNYVSSWQSAMSDSGLERIRNIHKDETGEDIEIPEGLRDDQVTGEYSEGEEYGTD